MALSSHWRNPASSPGAQRDKKAWRRHRPLLTLMPSFKTHLLILSILVSSITPTFLSSLHLESKVEEQNIIVTVRLESPQTVNSLKVAREILKLSFPIKKSPAFSSHCLTGRNSEEREWRQTIYHFWQLMLKQRKLSFPLLTPQLNCRAHPHQMVKRSRQELSSGRGLTSSWRAFLAATKNDGLTVRLCPKFS